MNWTALLSRSFARPKKKRTVNRYHRIEKKTLVLGPVVMNCYLVSEYKAHTP